MTTILVCALREHYTRDGNNESYGAWRASPHRRLLALLTTPVQPYHLSRNCNLGYQWFLLKVPCTSPLSHCSPVLLLCSLTPA